jgi:hypothetical protein
VSSVSRRFCRYAHDHGVAHSRMSVELRRPRFAQSAVAQPAQVALAFHCGRNNMLREYRPHKFELVCRVSDAAGLNSPQDLSKAASRMTTSSGPNTPECSLRNPRISPLRLPGSDFSTNDPKSIRLIQRRIDRKQITHRWDFMLLLHFASVISARQATYDLAQHWLLDLFRSL